MPKLEVDTAASEPPIGTPVVTAPVLATVHNLAEFAAAITAETRGGVQRWFRGTRSESHKLIPSLYRHPTVTEPNALIELE